MKKLLFITLAFVSLLSQAQFDWELMQPSNAYTFPTGGEFTPDGSKLFVISKFGKVFISNYENGQLQNPPTLLIDKESEVYRVGEQGMLDIVVDPNFGVDNYIYVIHCMKRTSLGLSPIGFNGEESASILRVTQFEIDLSTQSVISENIIIGNELSNGIPILASNHVGAALNFDNTGALLITTGDGASGAYRLQAIEDGIIPSNTYVSQLFRVQQIETLNGKVLRVDKNTGLGLPDNPFWTGNGDDVQSKVWGIGLRNPAFATYFNGALFISNTLGLLPQAIHVQFEPSVNHGYPFQEGFDNFQSGNAIYPQEGTTFANLYLGFQQSFQSEQDIQLRRWQAKPAILDYGRTPNSDLRTVNYVGSTLSPDIVPNTFSGISGAGIGYISTNLYGNELENSVIFSDFFSNDLVAFQYDENYKPTLITKIPNPRTGVTDIIENPATKELFVIHYGAALYKLQGTTLNIPDFEQEKEDYTSVYFDMTGKLLKSLDFVSTGIYIEKRMYNKTGRVESVKTIKK